ncbi:hypothetical protein AAHA92_26339 [Salvia divinorum]|uniref:Uncharacterized protein n=1 Tax=Salvia divinorum TaxID=28513 RepID=A0ABD1GGN8_SALDI
MLASSCEVSLNNIKSDSIDKKDEIYTTRVKYERKAVYLGVLVTHRELPQIYYEVNQNKQMWYRKDRNGRTEK